jgi:hypothetical protein
LPSGTGSGATNLDGLSDVDVTTTTPSEGNSLVYKSGIWKPGTISNGGSFDTNFMKVMDLDFSGLTCEHADNYITFPGIDTANVVGDFSVVHPSVLYFENGWNGYQYWMAINPYPKSNANYENPYIYCSIDGLNWIQPAGISNPITPKPAIGYGSDVHLVKDIDGKTVHCITRDVGTSTNSAIRRLRVLSSINGINWTEAPSPILESTVFDFASEGVFYDEVKGKYIMYAKDIRTGQNNQLELYECDSMTGTFTRFGQTSIPAEVVPSGRMLWHQEIRKINGLYVMVYAETSSTASGTSGKLKIAKSHDLVTWEVYKDDLLLKGSSWRANFYKSTFVLSENNGEVRLKLWYGTNVSNADWYVGYTEIIFNSERKRLSTNFNIQDFKNSLSTTTSVIFYDDFNRADTTTIGTPKIGSYYSGQTSWEIKGNQIKSVGTGANELLIRLTTGNYVVRYHIGELGKTANQFLIPKKTNGVYDRFLFGRQDSNNYNAVVSNSLGGASDNVKFDWTIRDGDVVQAFCVGTSIYIVVNGIHKYTHTIASGITANEVGLQLSGNSSFIDKIVVESL